MLNGFIDAELTAREQTQLQRLLGNDAEIEKRLAQLRRCKMLMGSLPQAEAPAEMLADIKDALARRSLLGERTVPVDGNSGVRALMFRKVIAAAAMIALAALLGSVIYSIVAPETVPDGPPVAKVDPSGPDKVILPPRTMLAMQFSGRLELKTPTFKEVDASINRAIEGNALVECTTLDRDADRTTYVLTCGSQGFDRLMSHLDKHWTRFGGAKLFVETKTFGEPIAVAAVTPAQITQIISQDTFDKSMGVAKDFAVLNDIAERLRSKSLFAADDKHPDLISIEMPALVWNEKPAAPIRTKATINLSIVVIAD